MQTLLKEVYMKIHGKAYNFWLYADFNPSRERIRFYETLNLKLWGLEKAITKFFEKTK